MCFGGWLPFNPVQMTLYLIVNLSARICADGSECIRQKWMFCHLWVSQPSVNPSCRVRLSGTSIHLL